jgi:hypothetical protein
MVLSGDSITFSAETVSPGKLAVSAVKENGEPVLTKSSAEYV